MLLGLQEDYEAEYEPESTFPQSIVDRLNNEEKNCCALCWNLFLHNSTKDDIVYLNQVLGISATVREFASLFSKACLYDVVRDFIQFFITYIRYMLYFMNNILCWYYWYGCWWVSTSSTETTTQSNILADIFSGVFNDGVWLVSLHFNVC